MCVGGKNVFLDQYSHLLFVLVFSFKKGMAVVFIALLNWELICCLHTDAHWYLIRSASLSSLPYFDSNLQNR